MQAVFGLFGVEVAHGAAQARGQLRRDGTGARGVEFAANVCRLRRRKAQFAHGRLRIRNGAIAAYAAVAHAHQRASAQRRVHAFTHILPLVSLFIVQRRQSVLQPD
ncbi:hypothetical protein D3C72_1992480 [compost metagenome]